MLTLWGFPCLLTARSANISDDGGLLDMLTKKINYFQSKPVNIPKLTILKGHGYHAFTSKAAVRTGLSSDYDEN